MALSPGTTLGSFEISGLLGVGGMGEVYRARDRKLGREVAIKVLPEALAKDESRLARFDREAKLLAALNHPNIAAIYDFQEADGQKFLVMELAEGATLAERISLGPIPVEEALPLFAQIAEALESAHEHGVIHRDLKPANIKITPGAKIKILDFGLAKAFEGETHESSSGRTLTLGTDPSNITAEGRILGTPAYMAPEQASGKEVDRRADIWAFGCCFYEALTGARPFKGETAAELLADIIKGEPDWSALPADTPNRVRILLWRSLQKDPRRRLRDIGEARFELSESGSDSSEAFLTPGPTALPSGWPLPKAIAAMALTFAVGALLAFAAVRNTSGPVQVAAARGVSRVSIELGTENPLSFAWRQSFDLSPDGQHLVFAAGKALDAVGESRSRLYLRRFDEYEARPIPDTEGAAAPFYSPDGVWIGYFDRDESKLKKVSVSGGAPIALADAPDPFGATWVGDDTIVYNPQGGGELWRVSASGRTAPETLTEVRRDRGEQEHGFPTALPDGKTVLFSIWRGGTYGDGRIAAVSLETGERTIVLEGGGFPQYLSSGHLIYFRNGELLAVPFDIDELKVEGAPRVILRGVLAEPEFHIPQFSVSGSGDLIYAPGAAPRAEYSLVWLDRQGTPTPVAPDIRPYDSPNLSPDGKKVAYSTIGRDIQIWVYDIERRQHRRVTSHRSFNAYPTWNPDGVRLLFVSSRSGPGQFFVHRFPTSSEPELIVTPEDESFFGTWSSDGNSVVHVNTHPSTGDDIWIAPLGGGGEARPILNLPGTQNDPAPSPDGRWLAYVSDESGRYEIYTLSLEEDGIRRQVSAAGGTWPFWSSDSRELFFRSLGEASLMLSRVDPEADSSFSAPEKLFDTENLVVWDFDNAGDRFLAVQKPEPPSIRSLNLVLNWREEVEGLVPTGK